ncbi:MAG: NUDIX domain-containing protein [Bacteroidales bacterium]|nr:NUDIX domain-containing protein [Bacteroidales bacterium]
MQQIYKVFTSSKVIVFSNSAPSDEHILVLDASALVNIHGILKNFEQNPSVQICYFVDAEVEKLFSNFYSHMRVIPAAGGIVYSPQKKVLIIYRLKSWDFPKGKIDWGETDEMAALREVSEETGIQDLTIVRRLQPTFHLYNAGDSYILKETHWFLMKCSTSPLLKPQFEENITQVKWVDLDELEKYKPLMYPSLHQLIDEVRHILFQTV